MARSSSSRVAKPVRRRFVARGEAAERPSKSELKRQQILDSAALVFGRRGYAEGTLGEIAAEAGTQTGSLYYYFESREHLVEEVLTRSAQLLIDNVNKALAELPPETDSLDRLMVMISSHVQTLLDNRNYTVAYQRIHDQVPPDIQQRVLQVPRSYARVWDQVVSEARDAGFDRPDMDLRLLRLLLIGSISWISEWYRPNGHSSPTEIIQALLSVFFEGAAIDKIDVPTRVRLAIERTPVKPKAARRKR